MFNEGVYSRFDALSRAFRRSRRSSGFSDGKAPASQYQIGEGDQREQLRGVLGQAAIARFAMAEQVLDDMKRLLNFQGGLLMVTRDEIAPIVPRYLSDVSVMVGECHFRPSAAIRSSSSVRWFTQRRRTTTLRFSC